MQKRAQWIGAGYAILKIFAGPTRLANKLLESPGLPENYDGMSLYRAHGIRAFYVYK